ncbi:transcriptional regulator [Sporosarcina sp. ACRSM]|uniref:transcriptional regulator n=1 Tax=Sporosarcina sp. ACRSM TaxID=2918216 RepID=UPI001EF6F829|nr:transcriptional regulator [Sporosarcina sp. ACRSM]
MHVELMKSMDRNYDLDMMYISKEGAISKRKIKVLQVGEISFRAYCYLRKSNRTFTIDNVLVLVPVIPSERMVI